MSVTLRRIRSFVAVAEFSSFRRAAEHLSISQPALSAHVQALEDEFGVPLLRRTTREVRLTEEGAEFVTRIKRTLDDLESIIFDLKEHAAIQRGRVGVACVPSIASQILPNILARFKERHPKISIHIHDDRAEVIEGRVERAEVDFAISPPPAHNSDLLFQHVVDDPYLAVLPKKHPLAGRPVITVEEFLEYPVIMMRDGINMRQVLDGALARVEKPAKVAYEVNNHDTLIGLVAGDQGIGAMPAMTLANVRNPLLDFAAIGEPPLTRQIGFLKRRGEPLGPAARKFAYAVKTYLRSLSFTPRPVAWEEELAMTGRPTLVREPRRKKAL